MSKKRKNIESVLERCLSIDSGINELQDRKDEIIDELDYPIFIKCYKGFKAILSRKRSMVLAKTGGWGNETEISIKYENHNYGFSSFDIGDLITKEEFLARYEEAKKGLADVLIEHEFYKKELLLEKLY